MRYDVIVIGAGPAGSTTARECASNGLSVLLLDKAEFPRDKPCGGGLAVRTAELLPFDISPVVERTINGLLLNQKRTNDCTLRSQHDLVYMTQRSQLDALMVQRAVDTGVQLQERSTIRSIDRSESNVVVRTADHSYEGRALVAADGTNGVTTRMAELDTRMWHGIALEGNITPGNGIPDKWKSVMALNLGEYPGGYGWLFPKGDHINIGVSGWKYLGPTLRPSLKELVHYYGFDYDDMWGVRGYHLPIRQPTSLLSDGNVLAVGDAAGLLDPLTGEGIHAGIWSGQAAARHLREYIAGDASDLSGYAAEVHEEWIPELRVSRRFHDLFHLTPGLYAMILRRSPTLWNFLCRVLLGQQTYAGAMKNRRWLNTAVELVSDLVRVTPFLQRAAGIQHPEPPLRFFVRHARSEKGHRQSASVGSNEEANRRLG